MMSAPSLDQLDPEQLRRRLEEAEDTLRAIRQGEIDALGGGGIQAEEVFTLEGGTESYRAFMEAMDLGAAALDASKRLLYANNALCELLERSSQALHGQGLIAPSIPKRRRPSTLSSARSAPANKPRRSRSVGRAAIAICWSPPPPCGSGSAPASPSLSPT